VHEQDVVNVEKFPITPGRQIGHSRAYGTGWPLSNCPINGHKWDSRSLPFPRTPTRSVTDVVNDHFVVSKFVHDQIFSDRKSQEAGLPRRSTDMRRSGNARSRMFNSSDETAGSLPVVRSYVRKNLIEIGKCAALTQGAERPDGPL
jgi:hypothetical protein